MHEGDFMEELLRRMGERVRQARLAHNMTQVELAEKIDVSPAFMSIIERGTKGMNVRTFITLCEALDVSADWLLGIESPASLQTNNEMIMQALEGCSPSERNEILLVIQTIQKMLNNVKLDQAKKE